MKSNYPIYTSLLICTAIVYVYTLSISELKAENLIIEGPLTLKDDLRGDQGKRLEIYTNTSATDSKAWIELWGNDDPVLPSRSGELTLAGRFIEFRYGSTDNGNSGNVGMTLSEEGTLIIRDAGAAPGDKKLVIGDDLFFTDLDQANTVGIYGNQDATEAGVRLGSNGPLLFGRDNTLIVDGKLYTKELRVRSNVWADFVFEDDYELQSLETIEAHIKTHKHLPDIPSAKQIKEDGINVAQMNALLLQKIEELTLHVIEMNKNMRTLKEENRRFKEILEDNNL